MAPNRSQVCGSNISVLGRAATRGIGASGAAGPLSNQGMNGGPRMVDLEPLVIHDSDSESEEDVPELQREKNLQFLELLKKVRVINHECITSKKSIFPYQKLEKLFADIKEKIPKIHSETTKDFIWENVLVWLYAMQRSFEGLHDLKHDDKFNLILSEIIAEYIHYKCWKFAKSKIKDSQMVTDNILTVFCVLFESNHSYVLMTLLRIDFRDCAFDEKYTSVLCPIFKKYLTKKFTDHSINFSYSRLILCFKKWKSLVHTTEQKEKINNIAMGEFSLKKYSTGLLPSEIPEREEKQLLSIFPRYKQAKQMQIEYGRNAGTRALLRDNKSGLNEMISAYFKVFTASIENENVDFDWYFLAEQQQMCKSILFSDRFFQSLLLEGRSTPPDQHQKQQQQKINFRQKIGINISDKIADASLSDQVIVLSSDDEDDNNEVFLYSDEEATDGNDTRYSEGDNNNNKNNSRALQVSRLENSQERRPYGAFSDVSSQNEEDDLSGNGDCVSSSGIPVTIPLNYHLFPFAVVNGPFCSRCHTPTTNEVFVNGNNIRSPEQILQTNQADLCTNSENIFNASIVQNEQVSKITNLIDTSCKIDERNDAVKELTMDETVLSSNIPVREESVGWRNISTETTLGDRDFTKCDKECVETPASSGKLGDQVRCETIQLPNKNLVANTSLSQGRFGNQVKKNRSEQECQKVKAIFMRRCRSESQENKEDIEKRNDGKLLNHVKDNFKMTTVSSKIESESIVTEDLFGQNSIENLQNKKDERFHPQSTEEVVKEAFKLSAEKHAVTATLSSNQSVSVEEPQPEKKQIPQKDTVPKKEQIPEKRRVQETEQVPEDYLMGQFSLSTEKHKDTAKLSNDVASEEKRQSEEEPITQKEAVSEDCLMGELSLATEKREDTVTLSNEPATEEKRQPEEEPITQKDPVSEDCLMGELSLATEKREETATLSNEPASEEKPKEQEESITQKDPVPEDCLVGELSLATEKREDTVTLSNESASEEKSKQQEESITQKDPVPEDCLVGELSLATEKREDTATLSNEPASEEKRQSEEEPITQKEAVSEDCLMGELSLATEKREDTVTLSNEPASEEKRQSEEEPITQKEAVSEDCLVGELSLATEKREDTVTLSNESASEEKSKQQEESITQKDPVSEDCLVGELSLATEKREDTATLSNEPASEEKRQPEEEPITQKDPVSEDCLMGELSLATEKREDTATLSNEPVSEEKPQTVKEPILQKEPVQEKESIPEKKTLEQEQGSEDCSVGNENIEGLSIKSYHKKSMYVNKLRSLEKQEIEKNTEIVNSTEAIQVLNNNSNKLETSLQDICKIDENKSQVIEDTHPIKITGNDKMEADIVNKSNKSEVSKQNMKVSIKTEGLHEFLEKYMKNIQTKQSSEKSEKVDGPKNSNVRRRRKPRIVTRMIKKDTTVSGGEPKKLKPLEELNPKSSNIQMDTDTYKDCCTDSILLKSQSEPPTDTLNHLASAISISPKLQTETPTDSLNLLGFVNSISSNAKPTTNYLNPLTSVNSISSNLYTEPPTDCLNLLASLAECRIIEGSISKENNKSSKDTGQKSMKKSLKKPRRKLENAMHVLGWQPKSNEEALKSILVDRVQDTSDSQCSTDIENTVKIVAKEMKNDNNPLPPRNSNEIIKLNSEVDIISLSENEPVDNIAQTVTTSLNKPITDGAETYNKIVYGPENEINKPTRETLIEIANVQIKEPLGTSQKDYIAKTRKSIPLSRRKNVLNKNSDDRSNLQNLGIKRSGRNGNKRGISDTISLRTYAAKRPKQTQNLQHDPYFAQNNSILADVSIINLKKGNDPHTVCTEEEFRKKIEDAAVTTISLEKDSEIDKSLGQKTEQDMNSVRNSDDIYELVENKTSSSEKETQHDKGRDLDMESLMDRVNNLIVPTEDLNHIKSEDCNLQLRQESQILKPENIGEQHFLAKQGINEEESIDCMLKSSKKDSNKPEEQENKINTTNIDFDLEAAAEKVGNISKKIQASKEDIKSPIILKEQHEELQTLQQVDISAQKLSLQCEDTYKEARKSPLETGYKSTIVGDDTDDDPPSPAFSPLSMSSSINDDGDDKKSKDLLVTDIPLSLLDEGTPIITQNSELSTALLSPGNVVTDEISLGQNSKTAISSMPVTKEEIVPVIPVENKQFKLQNFEDEDMLNNIFDNDDKISPEAKDIDTIFKNEVAKLMNDKTEIIDQPECWVFSKRLNWHNDKSSIENYPEAQNVDQDPLLFSAATDITVSLPIVSNGVDPSTFNKIVDSLESDAHTTEYNIHSGVKDPMISSYPPGTPALSVISFDLRNSSISVEEEADWLPASTDDAKNNTDQKNNTDEMIPESTQDSEEKDITIKTDAIISDQSDILIESISKIYNPHALLTPNKLAKDSLEIKTPKKDTNSDLKNNTDEKNNADEMIPDFTHVNKGTISNNEIIGRPRNILIKSVPTKTSKGIVKNKNNKKAVLKIDTIPVIPKCRSAPSKFWKKQKKEQQTSPPTQVNQSTQNTITVPLDNHTINNKSKRPAMESSNGVTSLPKSGQSPIKRVKTDDNMSNNIPAPQQTLYTGSDIHLKNSFNGKGTVCTSRSWVFKNVSNEELLAKLLSEKKKLES